MSVTPSARRTHRDGRHGHGDRSRRQHSFWSCVVLNNSKPTTFDTIKATATPSNAGGDPVTLTYVWTDTTSATAGPTGNGVLQTASNTAATTDSLNLHTATGVAPATPSR